jgi:hypothetical protein
LPEHVLEALAIGFDPDDYHGPCWTFPEVDYQGQVIGISRRYRDDSKRQMPGGNRGLTLPNGWHDHKESVFIAEGPSDTLALTAMALAGFGRPSNMGGVDHLIELLSDIPIDRQVIVLGEYDQKPNGDWPGRHGAVKVAGELAAALTRSVHWALPPDGAKDVRAWVLAQNPDPTCLDPWHDLGQKLVGELKLQTVPPPKLLVASLSDLPFEQPIPWPAPLTDDAFHGVAGEIVRAIEPHSEADPAALLIQFLVAFGNLVGHAAYSR